MDTTQQPSTTDDAPGLAPGDPRLAMAGAVRTAREVMAGVTPTQWDDPTPCGMSVRELLEHLVVVARRIGCAGRSQPLPEWPVDAADVADGDWLDAFTAAAHELPGAWPDEGLDDLRQLPWGTFPGPAVLGTYTNEVVVHTWDLARGTGQSPRWEDDVLETSMAAIREQLPDAERGPMWAAFQASLPDEIEWQDPFADAVPVPDGAPLIDRLVAWNGRDPRALAA